MNYKGAPLTPEIARTMAEEITNLVARLDGIRSAADTDQERYVLTKAKVALEAAFKFYLDRA